MKQLKKIILIVVCLVATTGSAQSSVFNDTIVVKSRDTIFCNVTEITPSFVYYVKADVPTDTIMLAKRIRKNDEAIDNITFCSAYTLTDICSPLIISKTDEYSGKKIIETPFVDFGNGTYRLDKKQEKIGLWIQFESSQILTIKAGEILYIKFTDGTIMKLVNQSTDISDYSESSIWTNSFYWTLTADQVTQLKTKTIDSMKIYITEYGFSDDEGKNFKQNINCLILTK